MTESLQNSKSYRARTGILDNEWQLFHLLGRFPKLQPPPRRIFCTASSQLMQKDLILEVSTSQDSIHTSSTFCIQTFAHARLMKFKAGARSKHSVGSESSSMQRFRKGWDKWWDNGRDETKKTVQVKDKKGYRVNK
ncbi:hypothetical protein BY996DRAFT_6439242 [Phakopsora pachyrhizi]|nr:hypothetical protein BY996DRAFT_6439242 [Phakopsora pachyrhizi]